MGRRLATAPQTAHNAALPEDLPGSVFALRARPNPFSSAFQLDVLWDRPVQETVYIEVFNAKGQLLCSQRLDAVMGLNVVSIQPTGPNSSGLLHVLAR